MAKNTEKANADVVNTAPVEQKENTAPEEVIRKDEVSNPEDQKVSELKDDIIPLSAPDVPDVPDKEPDQDVSTEEDEEESTIQDEREASVDTPEGPDNNTSEVAVSLMISNNVKEVWHDPVTGYWFTKKEYGEEYSRKVDRSLQYFKR